MDFLQPRIQKILEGIAKSKRVAGAYLFFGAPGSGKRQTAEWLADLLGCHKTDKFVLEPSGQTIKIDQIRELQQVVRYGPALSPYKLVIIEQADAMTDQAAAAFLKTLEEPVAGVIFILLVERKERLPLTIISRCQTIIFADPVSPWQPDPELHHFVQDLQQLRHQGTLEQLKFAAKLAQEKEKLEAILYQLAYFMRYELFNARAARIILETVRYLKRRANLRLALDLMCLRLPAAVKSGGINVS